MKAALPAEAQDKPLEIWFQDEARIGQKGTLTRIWAKRGSRPRARRDTRYEWAYLFGAVCPERGVGAALVLPQVNAEAMNLHLEEIGRSIAPNNVTLICLPPYAPELNPVENVWEFLRANNLALRIYETYDAIVDACCTAWNSLIATPARLTSITQRKWATAS